EEAAITHKVGSPFLAVRAFRFAFSKSRHAPSRETAQDSAGPL
ncbi:MAG: hypothetical protein ACI8T1_005030, partial [Verrucomicrobiales bacterium]